MYTHPYSGSVGGDGRGENNKGSQKQPPQPEEEHVMLSYNWGFQGTVKRINSSLRKRGYETWIDIEKVSILTT